MLSYLLLSIPPAAWAVAALNDIKALRIPNWISLFLIGSFPVAALAFGFTLSEFLTALLMGAGMLVVGFSLFSLNLFGGGDAKLLAASAPWIGMSAMVIFLYKVALMGGLLALALLMFRKTPLLPVYAHSDWIMKLHQSGKHIPYGVAIAAGGLWTLPDTLIFSSVFG